MGPRNQSVYRPTSRSRFPFPPRMEQGEGGRSSLCRGAPLGPNLSPRQEESNEAAAMLTVAYPWLLVLILLPLLLHQLLAAYWQTKIGTAVPFLSRLEALTGQHPASGAVVMKTPLMQKICLEIVWLSIMAALARPQ